MTHNLLAAAIFIAMVLAPCVIAMFSANATASESDPLDDGFI